MFKSENLDATSDTGYKKIAVGGVSVAKYK